jgi:hypothetical protein
LNLNFLPQIDFQKNVTMSERIRSKAARVTEILRGVTPQLKSESERKSNGKSEEGSGQRERADWLIDGDRVREAIEDEELLHMQQSMSTNPSILLSRFLLRLCSIHISCVAYFLSNRFYFHKQTLLGASLSLESKRDELVKLNTEKTFGSLYFSLPKLLQAGNYLHHFLDPF